VSPLSITYYVKREGLTFDRVTHWMPWPFTKVKAMLQCTRYFFRLYLDPNRSGRGLVDTTPEITAGKIRHSFIEAVMKGETDITSYLTYLSNQVAPEFVKYDLMRGYDPLQELHKNILSDSQRSETV
jgi:hypothetical protein